jgi:hypothetical protein
MRAGRTGAGALALCVAICAALAAAPAAMAEVAFPSTPFGASSANQDVVILNEEPDPITLGQLAVSGPDAGAFQVVTDTCAGQTLVSGDDCSVTMAFRPASVGTHAATLEVPVEGEPDAPFSAELSGEGIRWLRLTPTLLDFGTVLGFSAAQDVLVENVSGREIPMLSTRIEPVTGAFRYEHSVLPGRCGFTLAAGASCLVRVRFSGRVGVLDEARLVFGRSGPEMGSVALRGIGAPRPRPRPTPVSTPDATAVLRKRLRLALDRLRGRSREVLLKRGLVVRGVIHPAHGELGLVVRARRASSAAMVVAARRGMPALAGQRTNIHAHVTRAGRRLLRSGRRLVLDVRLTLVARPDSRLSEATGVLRLGRAPQPARHPQPRSP